MNDRLLQTSTNKLPMRQIKVPTENQVSCCVAVGRTAVFVDVVSQIPLIIRSELVLLWAAARFSTADQTLDCSDENRVAGLRHPCGKCRQLGKGRHQVTKKGAEAPF